jgi:hypothetical protein
LRAQSELRFRIASSGGTASQVRDAVHVQAPDRLPKLLSADGEEAAEQSACAEFLQSDPSAFGATPRPPELFRQAFEQAAEKVA